MTTLSTTEQPISIAWYQSLSAKGAFIMILMAFCLLAGVLLVVNFEGKPAVVQATTKHIEYHGNTIVESLHGRSLEIAALVRTIATTAALLPKQAQAFEHQLLPLYDFGGDLAIAGGGVWPEPYSFDTATDRRSFFWGRNAKGAFVYYNDYNKPGGKGYSHEEWYVTSRYLKPSRCFWSKSYMDPFSFQPMVTCTVGWFEHGRFVGTATVDLKLDGIAEKLEALQKKIGGYAMLLDRNGKFIAFPKAGDDAKAISFDNDRHKMVEFLTIQQFAQQHPLFQAVADAYQQLHQHILQLAKKMHAFDTTLAAKIDHDSYQINADEAAFISAVVTDPLAKQNNDSYLLSKIHIDNDLFFQQPVSIYFFHVPDTYWTLAIVKSVADENIVASALAQALFIKMGALIIILMFLAYLLLRIGIVNPLTRMSARVRKADAAVASNRLSATEISPVDFSWESNTHNEVAVLGLSFQRLLQAFSNAQTTIQDQNINLEERIIERSQALNAKENELVHLLDAMNEVHFKLNNQYVFEDVTLALASLLGENVEGLSQTHLVDYFSDPNDFSDFIFKMEQRGMIKGFEWKLVHPDSNICWLSVNAQLFRDQHGAIESIQGLLTNITHNKAMQDEKRNMQRKVEHVQRLESLGVLAGGIAHDFNNLLTAIMGNASLAEIELGRHVEKNTKALGMMQQIQLASKRAAYLCSQMLAYSGKGQFIIKPINLSALLHEMLGILRVSIDKSVELDCHLLDGLANIDGDEAQIQQVVMNLVINASEAIGGKQGRIVCTTAVIHADKSLLNASYLDDGLSEGEYVQLTIEDNGCGMSKETQAHIFDPFFTTKFTGRGLGMSALLGIIRGHKGSILVYSELGEGTTFRVIFPISQGYEHQPLQAPDALTREASHGTILVVDDEESVREMAAMMIQNMGFQVLVANDGQQALEIYRQHAQDIKLVLLDYIMPNMNGREVFAELIKITPDVRVILTSGYTELKATSAFQESELCGFLQKPYDFDVLNQALKKALET